MKTKTLIILVTLLSFVIPAGEPISAQEQASRPVLLQVNDYFILYTYPKAPYLDQKGRLLIPLKSVQDILGGKVVYDPKAKAATVEMLGRKVTATIGSKQITVNDNIETMDTVPVLIQNAMFLPVSVLLKDTEAQMEWDAQQSILKLKHESFNQGKILTYSWGQDMYYGNGEKNVIDADAFTLKSYEWDDSGKLVIHAEYDKSLEMTPQQIDIHPLLAYESSYVVDPYSRPVNQSKIEITQPGSLTFTRKFGESSHRKLQYIISVGRLVK